MKFRYHDFRREVIINGSFSQNGEEFLIDRPDLPRPLVNLLSNSQIRSTFSQTGDGSALIKDLEGKTQQLIRSDDRSQKSGRHIYIYDHDLKQFWSANGSLTDQPADFFQARHSQSQTVVESANHGLRTRLTFQLPINEAAETWQIAVVNESADKRRLSIFIVVDFQLKDGLVSTAYSQGRLLLTEAGGHSQKLYFMATDKIPDSYDSSRGKFFGSFDNWSAPSAVKDGRCGRSLAYGEPSIGVLQKNLTLGSKTATEIRVVIGGQFFKPSQKAAALRQINSLVERLLNAKSTDSLNSYWQERNERLRHRSTIQTPDEALNRLDNYWLKSQLVSACDWAVTKNLIAESGSIAQQAQLASTVLAYDPSRSTEVLFSLFKYQDKEGATRQPALSDNNNSESTNVLLNNIELAQATISLIKETGDIDQLKHSLPYRDGGEGSLLEHLVRLIGYVISSLDEHLVKQNQLQSTALSARLTHLLAAACPLLEAVHDQHLSNKYQRLITEINSSLKRRLWDGRWFAHGRGHGGRLSTKTGSAAINLAAQIWPIISGQIDTENAVRLLKQIDKHPSHLANFWPPITELKDGDPLFGLPGSNGNASIEVELIIDLIAAATIANQADLAWQWLNIISPTNHNGYQAEPFRLPERIYGISHPRFGEAETIDRGRMAGRFDQLIRERILGLQPVLGGLKVDPCLPSSWRQAEISRHFRGADYHFRFQNRFRGGKIIDRIVVDGNRLTGNVIRPFHGGLHFIEVFLS